MIMLLFFFLLLAEGSLGLEAVGSGGEGDGVVLAVGGDVCVLAGDCQGCVLRLRVVKFAFFLS